MSDYGIKISQLSFDALSESDPGLMLFDSEWLLFKVFAQGSFTYTSPASSNANATVPHGLGYAPTVDGYWSLDNATWHKAGFQSNAINEKLTVSLASDATNVYLSVDNFNTSSQFIYLRYVVYLDGAS